MRTNVMRSMVMAAGILLGTAFGGCSQMSAPVIQADRNTADPFEQAVDAAFKGDLGFIQTCVESDPRYLEAVDNQGRTLLHYAAEGGHKDIVTYLLEKGADINAEDDNGYYPLDAAIQGDAPKDLVDMLKDAAMRANGQQ